MQVDDALIDKLCRLAMLEFDAAEKEQIKKDLEKMIGFIDKLNKLDTTGVEPLLHLTANRNIYREDRPGAVLARDEALKNAPHHDEAYFKVPRMIRKNS